MACRAGEPAEAGEQSPELERGADLYQTYCRTCHGGASGGRISDSPPPHNSNGHTWHHSDCQLIDTVMNGSPMGQMMRLMPGGEDARAMPLFVNTLSEQDVEAILAYVKTWWRQAQRDHQARVTSQVC